MKMMTGLFALALSFSSIASSGDQKTFVYDGSQPSIQLNLSAEKTHTEYDIQTVNTTCTRQEISGYTTFCSGGVYGGGYYGGGRYYRGPRPYGGYVGNICTQNPIYRTVSYPCTQTIRTPFEVKDYDVNAQVLVDVTALESTLKANEKITVKLHGEDLAVTAQGSENFFIVLKKQDKRAYMNGSVKQIEALYAVELVESAPVIEAINSAKMSFKDSKFSVKMGPLSSVQKNIGYSLNVTRKRTLAKNIVLFDRDLKDSEVVMNLTDANSIATIDTSKLNFKFDGRRFELTGTASVKTDGTLLNKAQFANKLSVSQTIKYKNKNR